jgi:hypothetical protein
MTPVGLVFVIVAAVATLALPRRWAAMPLLLAACYMPLGQGVKVGPFYFTVIRILVGVGVLRCALRGEFGGLRWLGLDRALGVWAVCAILSAQFHETLGEALVFRLGMVYNFVGPYLILRALCRDEDDLRRLVQMTAIVLSPVALEMLSEQLTGTNRFATLGGVPVEVAVREGKLRAQGPFAHSILAGTAGAAVIPLMCGLWGSSRKIAMLGLCAGCGMVLCSRSSGPVMTAVAGLFAVGLWPLRNYTRAMRVFVTVMYIALNCTMKVPAYFLIARIDLTGSSTGWHRAELIRSSIEHLSEWWIAGTDYTRHWMPTGVSWSGDHTDITNHYLHYGVVGGLPLLVATLVLIYFGFRYVGQSVKTGACQGGLGVFQAWCFGAALFAHATTWISVSYFDQTILFFLIVLAGAGALESMRSSSCGEQGGSISASPLDPIDECRLAPLNST